MILRVARHTHDLESMRLFYTTVIGLELLGSFEAHDGYNGIFLGLKDQPWHLEFTQSETPARHNFDEDDLLVFYPETKEDHTAFMERINAAGLALHEPVNPYWKQHGILIKDPDGYGVIISREKME